jgi:hypothetical protein
MACRYPNIVYGSLISRNNGQAVFDRVCRRDGSHFLIAILSMELGNPDFQNLQPMAANTTEVFGTPLH